MSARWSGSIVRRARAHFTPMVEAGDCVCPKCGLPIAPDQRWQVGHQQDQALDGGHELENLAPEHGVCNERAGGRLGQAMKRRPAPPKVKRREW